MFQNLRNLSKFSFFEYFFLLFPIVLILRPIVINTYLILIIFFFIYNFYKKKYLYFFKKEKWVWFFLFFIFYSIFRGLFAIDASLATTSSISLIRFLTFSLFIFLCIPDTKNLNIIIKIWTIILILLCIDTLIQYFFLRDIFNFHIIESNNRLSGPFGKRGVIGAYLSYISIPILFYFFSVMKNFNFIKKLLIFLFVSLLLITISLSGERLALIIFLSSLFVIFIFNFRIKIFIYLSILTFIILLSLYYLSFSFNIRIYQFYLTISNFSDSPWFRLYQSSYLAFKSNILFGVGLKNYAIFCDNQLIDPLPLIDRHHPFCSTHPHNLYLEILSETGVVGFLLLSLTFVAFFSSIITKIKRLKNNKIYKEYKGLLFGNIFILFIYLWPIKTSGRFFTTWNGSFFWFNLGMALLITKNFYKKDK
jgi:O-antigen ligase